MQTKKKFVLTALRWVFVFGLITAEKIEKPQIERLPSPRTNLGEIPHWDSRTLSLYYVDIHEDGDYNSSLLRYDYRENRVYSASVKGAPTLLFLLPIACTKDQFLVGIDRTAVIVRWDGRSPEATITQPLFKVNCDRPDVFFNDVKTDDRGRFYGGTRINIKDHPCASGRKPIGSFYSYESGKCLKKLFGNVTISNGITWVRTTNKFYYIDSCSYDIKEFDYNKRTGDISNGHRIFSAVMQDGTKPDYLLDGMTNDRDGNLYVAAFNGSQIVKLNPRGQILAQIEMPAPQVTSMAFGGPNLDILYVTTANLAGTAPESSGYLYKVTGLNVKGYAGVRFRLFKSCVKRTPFADKDCS